MDLERIIAMWRSKRTTRSPRTFNEKIIYKAAFDRRPILTTFADKIRVRDYVAATVGDQYLTKLYCSSIDGSDIDWDNLPTEFVFKVNHGSGGVVVVWSGAEPHESLPENVEHVPWTSYRVKPENLVVSDLVRLGEHWLSLDYSWYRGCSRIPEWAYKNITRGVMIEELLVDSEGALAADYKFHVFNGKCEFINVLQRHAPGQADQQAPTSNIFTPSWEPVDLVMNHNRPAKTAPVKPEQLEEMLEIAGRLANGIDYVRVDLYNVDGRIVFGELTNYPMAGQNSFEPASFDLEWGNMLMLDSRKN